MDLSSNATIRSTRSRTNSCACAAAWVLVQQVAPDQLDPLAVVLPLDLLHPAVNELAVADELLHHRAGRAVEPAEVAEPRHEGGQGRRVVVRPHVHRRRPAERAGRRRLFGTEQAPTGPAHRITPSSARAGDHVFIGIQPLLAIAQGRRYSSARSHREDLGDAEVLAPLAAGGIRQKGQLPGFAASSAASRLPG